MFSAAVKLKGAREAPAGRGGRSEDCAKPLRARQRAAVCGAGARSAGDRCNYTAWAWKLAGWGCVANLLLNYFPIAVTSLAPTQF